MKNSDQLLQQIAELQAENERLKADNAANIVTAKSILNDVTAERDALAAKLATLEADAERYRWLRDPTTDVSLVLDKRTGWVPPDENVPGVGGYHTYEYRAGDELDAAIDAAKGGQHEDA
jgi:hypothetical protein